MAQRGYDLQTLGPNVGIICRHGGSGVEHLPKMGPSYKFLSRVWRDHLEVKVIQDLRPRGGFNEKGGSHP